MAQIAFRQRVAMLTQISQFAFDHRLGLIELPHLRDHREHDAQRTPGRRAQQRTNLAAQQTGAVESEPDRPGLVALTVPPCSSTICFAIDRPSPMPERR